MMMTRGKKMKDKRVYEISESEKLIMDLLWDEKDGKTFIQIVTFLNIDCGKEWKKQTVHTFIKRLMEKGLVEATQSERNKVYFTTLTRVDYEKGRARKMLKDFYNGSINAFLSALTGGQKIDKEFADELRKLIDNDERVD